MTNELRIKIAESLGWKLWPIVGLTPPGTEPPFTLNSYPPCPDFFGDANAALQLVEVLAKDGWGCECNNESPAGWYCEFINRKPPYTKTLEVISATGSTLPEAICLAYCAVKSIQTDK